MECTCNVHTKVDKEGKVWSEHQKMFSFVKNAIFWKTSCDRILSKTLFDDEIKKKRTETLYEKKSSIFDHILAPQGNEIV